MADLFREFQYSVSKALKLLQHQEGRGREVTLEPLDLNGQAGQLLVQIIMQLSRQPAALPVLSGDQTSRESPQLFTLAPTSHFALAQRLPAPLALCGDRSHGQRGHCTHTHKSLRQE